MTYGQKKEYKGSIFSFSYAFSRSNSYADGGGRKTPLPKICHTYPTKMKLGTVIPYLKKIQKHK